MKQTLLAILIGIFLIAGCAKQGDDKWTLSEIEKKIGVNIPENARNISSEAGGQGDLLIFLTFEVPLYEGNEFADNFCDGRLREGYNPFNSDTFSEALENNSNEQIFFAEGTPYFGYTRPNTTNLEWGLECDFNTKLLVDRREGIDHITLQKFFP